MRHNGMINQNEQEPKAIPEDYEKLRIEDVRPKQSAGKEVQNSFWRGLGVSPTSLSSPKLGDLGGSRAFFGSLQKEEPENGI